MIYYFLINTVRYLRKNGIFTVVNIIGLAFGFACAILITMHTKKEYSYNSDIPEHERVFNLVEKSPESPLGNTTICYALAPLLAQYFPEIEYFARTENFSSFSNCIVSYQTGNNNKYKSFNEPDFYLADHNLFKILPYPFIEGSSANALKEPNSIVLSKETSKKYFGKGPALGKILALNNKYFFKVSGVVDIPDYVTFHFSMLAPITSLRSNSTLEGWDSNGQPVFKLKKGVDYKEFNRKIAHFYGELKPANIRNPEQLTLSLLPITERRLYYNKNPLYLLIFTCFVVLSISILNYVNMSTSLVQKRKSEIGLKKVSGANRKIVLQQFMTETGLVCFLAISLGILLAIISIPYFKDFTGSDLLPFFKKHWMFLVQWSIILWLVVTILSGFYPALILSGMKPLSLMGKRKEPATGMVSKNITVTFQFIVSIILVILTLMINRQYKFMTEIPLGLDNKYVIQIPFNDNLKENFQSLKNEIKKLASVKDVCAASSMPVGIPNHSGVSWIDDDSNKREESFGFAIVSDGYTQTFDMKMAMGNEFTINRPHELNGIIINETAAKRLGFENPLGKQLYFWGRENTITGIVKDFQNNYLFNYIKPMIISAHPQNQHFTKYMYISLLPGEMNNTIESIAKVIKEIAPEFPFEYSFTNKEVEDYILEIKQINRTFRFASVVSILLAVIGLIALTYHATQARIKEIGIRKVNGAKNIQIMNLLNSTFLYWLLGAFFIGCPIAWTVISHLLDGLAYKASIAWWIFASAGIMVSFIALLTVSLQSLRVATRNPVEALRYE